MIWEALSGTSTPQPHYVISQALDPQSGMARKAVSGAGSAGAKDMDVGGFSTTNQVCSDFIARQIKPVIGSAWPHLHDEACRRASDTLQPLQQI
jgi:hypothetical protein